MKLTTAIILILAMATSASAKKQPKVYNLTGEIRYISGNYTSEVHSDTRFGSASAYCKESEISGVECSDRAGEFSVQLVDGWWSVVNARPVSDKGYGTTKSLIQSLKGDPLRQLLSKVKSGTAVKFQYRLVTFSPDRIFPRISDTIFCIKNGDKEACYPAFRDR